MIYTYNFNREYLWDDHKPQPPSFGHGKYGDFVNGEALKTLKISHCEQGNQWCNAVQSLKKSYLHYINLNMFDN